MWGCYAPNQLGLEWWSAIDSKVADELSTMPGNREDFSRQ